MPLPEKASADFCVSALEEAIRKTGVTPQISNTDQSGQFAGKKWIDCLTEHKITPSMDGKGR